MKSSDTVGLNVIAVVDDGASISRRFLECTQLTGTKGVKLLIKHLILSQPEEFIFCLMHLT